MSPPGDGAFAARGLSVHFGGVVALEGVSLQVQAGEVLGDHRAQRRRQDDAVQRDLRLRRAAVGDARVAGRDAHGLRTDRLAQLGIARTLQGIGLFPG